MIYFQFKISVINQIEEMILKFCKSLINEFHLSPFSSFSTTFESCLNDNNESIENQSKSQFSHSQLRLKKSPKIIDCNNKNSQEKYHKLWILMAKAYELLQDDKISTQRDIFYTKVKQFRNQGQVDSLLLEMSAILRCTRRSLHVVASSKGFLIGNLIVKRPKSMENEQIRNSDFECFNSEQTTIDCTKLESTGLSISESLLEALDSEESKHNARLVLVVEKEAVFLRLAQEKIWLKCPMIMITGKGFADFATRAVIHKIHQKWKLPIKVK